MNYSLYGYDDISLALFQHKSDYSFEYANPITLTCF